MAIKDGRPERLSIWERIAAQSADWIGGTLIDCDDDPMVANVEGGARTRITGVVWKPNGADSMFFAVDGEDFSCGGDRKYIGVVGASRYGDGFELRGYGGHEFHMLKPTSQPAEGK
jgi:hypothetical protein